MSSFLHIIRAIFAVFLDGLALVKLCFRPTSAVAAENLFLRTLARLSRLFFVLSSAACNGPRAPAPPSFDLIIAHGRVVDGTGASWFRADVGIVGDRIVRVGDLETAPAKQRVDATNLVVAPGFIDMLGQSEFNILVASHH
jgi:hypothetical protein